MATSIRGETKEERERRRAEKERNVRSYRSAMLSKVNKETQGAKLSKDFSCPVRYRNDLPALPVAQKMLQFPFDEDMAYAYDPINGVSSESGALHKVPAGPDLGLLFDLVDTAAYLPNGATGTGQQMHPLDAKITSEDFAKPASKAAKARDVLPKVEWMMRTQHMHLDLFDNVYKHVDPTQLADDIQARKRAGVDATFRVGHRKERIEASFKAVSGEATVKHPTNNGVAPVRVWTVLPDADRWTTKYMQVAFDGPAETAEDAALPPPAKRARLERALLRTRPDQPVNIKESTLLADYMLPVGVPGSRSEPVPVASSRAYHMVFEKVSPAAGEEAYVLFWHGDDAEEGRAGTVTFAPMHSRITCTGVKAAAPGAAGAASVVVVPRPATASEEDLHLAKAAELLSANAAAVRAAAAERQLERQRVASEAHAAEEAAAAPSSAATYGRAGVASTAPAALIKGNSASLSDVSADEEED